MSMLRYLCARSYLVRQLTNPHPSAPEPFAYPHATPSSCDSIIVAMSSGVDSSVTAALLAEKHGASRVRGIYMANWSQTAKCTEGEWNDVQKVCAQLGIACDRINFEKEYWTDVFSPMLDMYLRGLTPNPDLGCNRYIKFGKMVEYLASQYVTRPGKWWLATGHYARVEAPGSGPCNLVRAFYANKDQSYYLASIPQSVLSHVLMPLGHYTKPQVREMARHRGLCTAEKPDSVGLCFVSPEHTKFRHFLDEYLPSKPGNIISKDGRVWGRHQGLWHATIGQNLGVSMPQGDPRYSGVWFVSEKRVASNELVIVRGSNNPALFHNCIDVTDWLWFGDEPDLSLPLSLLVQYRSLQVPAQVRACSWTQGRFRILLAEKQRAMAPGQNVVLYQGNHVLGSGILSSVYTED